VSGAEVWVDHEYTPRERKPGKCPKCSNNLIYTHQCHDPLPAIRTAYNEYNNALKRREHAGVAASRLAEVVAEALGGER